ncbi:hypothetical protein AALO_G00258560 [Alosa alosa]|uniref:Uncharacterized protein n=1 Tax=Alosa alosa TaxID=278164 RepID=A0AAV6FWT1_9TELE|nr:hypothetical protein AALO_G00258560 [Alosa alosa]
MLSCCAPPAPARGPPCSCSSNSRASPLWLIPVVRAGGRGGLAASQPIFKRRWLTNFQRRLVIGDPGEELDDNLSVA